MGFSVSIPQIPIGTTPGTVADGGALAAETTAREEADAVIQATAETFAAREETRMWSVKEVESFAVTIPTTIAEMLGPGTVSSIQLAFFHNATTADNRSSVVDVLIRLTIDDQYMVMPLGIFYLLYANGGNSDPQNTWITDKFAVTDYGFASNGGSMGAYRRIYIPFQSVFRLEILPSLTAILTYSQVQYYPGTPPLWLSGTRKKRFSFALTPLQTVAFGAGLNILNVTGRGQLEGIHVIYLANTARNLSFLEYNPTLVIDGSSQNYGGTEDFFGTQFYGDATHGKLSESWGLPNSTNFTDGSTTYTAVSAYRFFDKDPVVFNESLSLTLGNGQAGQSSTTTAITMGAFAGYYLDTNPVITPPTLAQTLAAYSPGLCLIADYGCLQANGSACVAGTGTNSTGYVSQWSDQSQWQRHAFTWGGQTTPYLYANALNGRQGIYFNVASDGLSTSYYLSLVPTGYAIICVEVPGGAGGAHRTVTCASGSPTAIGTLHRSDSNRFYVNGHICSYAGTPGTPYLWSLVAPASGTFLVNINGVNYTDGTTGAIDWGTVAMGNCALTGESGDVTICAVVIVPAANVAGASAALAAYYGITLG